MSTKAASGSAPITPTIPTIPTSRTGVQHNGNPISELFAAFPPAASRAFVAPFVSIPKFIGDRFIEQPIQSTAGAIFIWNQIGLIGLTTSLKLIGSALRIYDEPNLIQNTASDLTEGIVDLGQQGLLGTIQGLSKSLFKTGESLGNDAKDQWNEGMGRSFQNQEQQRAYARAQLSGNCGMDKECRDTMMQSFSSGSFVIPTVFLLATLGLCAYAYQLLTTKATQDSKKVENESDKPETPKA